MSEKTWALTVWRDDNHKERVTCRGPGDAWNAIVDLFTGGAVRVEIEAPRPMWVVRIWQHKDGPCEVRKWATRQEAAIDATAYLSMDAHKVEIERP